MPFRFVDNVATADCAVEVESGSLNGLFRDAACALVESMIPISMVDATQSWRIELDEENLERLLYSWLSELVFIKDSENVLFREFDVVVTSDGGSCHLAAEVKGEPIDHDRHDIGVDVKAVTMHMLKVAETADSWSAFVIFDL